MIRTIEGVSPIMKVILKKHPDYDLSRHHFVSGDVVTNVKTSALCFVVESAIEYCNCIVIRAGFGMPKGTEVRVPYTDLEYFEYGTYQRPQYSISKRIFWEPGDIVQNDGCLLLIKKRPETDPTCVHAIVLEADNERVPIGGCFVIPDPYWAYHGGIRPKQNNSRFAKTGTANRRTQQVSPTYTIESV